MPGHARTWGIYPGAAWHDRQVPTLSDLARDHTSLSGPDLEWLHYLVSDWQLLADLSFADLILWVPLSPGGGGLPAWGAPVPHSPRPPYPPGRVR